VTSEAGAHDPKLLIAIDGPAGAGKSTVAARLAQRLGLPYLDTGAMYRAIGLLALRDGLSPDIDASLEDRIVALMESHAIGIEADGYGTRILIDGDDVGSEIRAPECSMMASAVSALPAVRRALVPLQRELGRERGGVMEGRDIGTVVLPDAQLKVFLTASTEERARRRHRDLARQDVATSLEEVLEQQRMRDHQDTSRADSPLQVASGAVVVDTTGMTLEEVVDRLIEELDRVLHRPA
jgi:cytidylate kinase